MAVGAPPSSQEEANAYSLALVSQSFAPRGASAFLWVRITRTVTYEQRRDAYLEHIRKCLSCSTSFQRGYSIALKQ